MSVPAVRQTQIIDINVVIDAGFGSIFVDGWQNQNSRL